MSALLAQAQQVQQKLMEAQEQLANTEVHGQAGGGLVQVTMKGSGEVVGVSFERERGRWVYELKVVETGGRLVKLYVDAASAEILKRERD